MVKNPEPVRCPWCGDDPLYIRYHDEEWGRPVRDERTRFEFLILEGAQAGLSWITVLRRREHYRRAFAGFDPERVARFDAADIGRLLADPGIIRNRAKIAAAVANARHFLETQREFGSFDAYLKRFLPNDGPVVNRWEKMTDIPAATPFAEAISRDMKRRGFRFFGPTICYAFLQATGYVNDHLTDCFRHPDN